MSNGTKPVITEEAQKKAYSHSFPIATVPNGPLHSIERELEAMIARAKV